MSDSWKCLVMESVSKQKVSDNWKFLITANISQQTMSFRPFTESVWQQQMSDNCKYLLTDNVFYTFYWKCLTTANVWQLQISRNGQCLSALCLKRSGNRQCLYGQCLYRPCLAPESVWQQKVSFWFKTDFVTQRKMVRNGKCRQDSPNDHWRQPVTGPKLMSLPH